MVLSRVHCLEGAAGQVDLCLRVAQTLPRIELAALPVNVLGVAQAPLHQLAGNVDMDTPNANF